MIYINNFACTCFFRCKFRSDISQSEEIALDPSDNILEIASARTLFHFVPSIEWNTDIYIEFFIRIQRFLIKHKAQK